MTFDEWWKSKPVDHNGRRKGKALAMNTWDAATKAAIPEGYVLVPIESNEAMIRACYMLLATEGSKVVIDDLYKTMIKSAQKEE